MNDQLLAPLLGTILAALGGLVGYFIKDFLDKKKELSSENIKVKREMYKEFIVLVFKVMNNKDSHGSPSPLDIKKDLYRFYEDYSLYSSPEVINAFADYMQYIYKNPKSMDTKTILAKLAKVIKSMRREMGLSNRGLGKNGEKIFRAMFNDFDNLK